MSHSGKIVVRGKITSEEDSSALPGVSVIQKGTANGVQTDQDGLFELALEPGNDMVLTFSFIGLVTEEVRLKQPVLSPIDVKMSADVTGFLGDIVIVGEGHTDAPYTERSHRLKRFWKKIAGWF